MSITGESWQWISRRHVSITGASYVAESWQWISRRPANPVHSPNGEILRPVQKLALVALGHTLDDLGLDWASAKQISAACGLAAGTTTMALAGLENYGVVCSAEGRGPDSHVPIKLWTLNAYRDLADTRKARTDV